MRCRVGDLVVIVSGLPKWIGCLGRVVGPPHFSAGPRADWSVDVFNRPEPRYGTWAARDEQLRPIRPSEGTDETLTWLDVPHKEVA